MVIRKEPVYDHFGAQHSCSSIPASCTELPQGFCKWLTLLQSCSSSSSIFPYNCLNPFNREENQTGCQESVHLKPLPKLLTKVVTLLFHETICSPDIRVYAYAAAQVKKAMEVIPYCTDTLRPLPLSSTTFWVFFSFSHCHNKYVCACIAGDSWAWGRELCLLGW